MLGTIVSQLSISCQVSTHITLTNCETDTHLTLYYIVLYYIIISHNSQLQIM